MSEGEPDAKILAMEPDVDDADNNNNMRIPDTADSRGAKEKEKATAPSSSSTTTSGVGGKGVSSVTPSIASSKASRRSTEDAAADRFDRSRNRKAERYSGGKGSSKPPEPAHVPGAQRIGASQSSSNNDVTMEKVKLQDGAGVGVEVGVGVGILKDDDNNKGNMMMNHQDDPNNNNNEDVTVGGEAGVPLAAEISDIHEENERLRRELEERNKHDQEEGGAGNNNPNIPVAQVLPSKVGAIVGDEDDDDQDEEGCRPTKTNIACAILCFAVILGAVIGIVVSANSGSKVIVEEEGSTQPSSPPTWTQMPSTAPSETPPWLFVAEKVFSTKVETRISNEEFLELLAQSPNRIVWRQCPNCTLTHQNIYYKRLTDPPSEERDFNGEIPSHFLDLFLNNWYSEPKNALNVDFELYSTYQDALFGSNKWEYCNYDQKKIGFPRDCAPNGTAIVPKQWTSFLGNDRYGAGVDHVFYVENDVPNPPIDPDDNVAVDDDGLIVPEDDDGGFVFDDDSPLPDPGPTISPTPTLVVPAPTDMPLLDDDGGFVFDDDDASIVLPDDDFLLPDPGPQGPTIAPSPTWVVPAPTDVPFPTMPFPAPSNLPIWPSTSAPVLIPAPTTFPPVPAPTGMPFPTPSNVPISPSTSAPVFIPAPTNMPVPAPTIQPTFLPSSEETYMDFISFCPEGSVSFEFVIFTDFFGAETTWDLKGPNGVPIVSGGPYGDLQTVGVGMEMDGEPYCIPVESCYSLTINDEFGDGIYSPGGYRVSLADTVIVDVMGGSKFTARTIDIAATVVTLLGETVTTQNCEDVPIETRCSLEDFMGEEFLGRIGQEFSYSVTIGESFTQKDMRADTQSLVGSFESLEGNVAFYSGGDYCEAIGGQRSGTVELLESSQVDSVQTFFSQPSDCTFAVEITVPACKTT